jgi:hypothetical protein
MSEFSYTVNLKGGVSREINLDQAKYIDHGPSMDDPVTLHFGPGYDLTIEAGSEARRFVDFWENRWRKAAKAA